MSIAFTANVLLELAADRNCAVLLNDVAFEPVAGRGSPISPVTYAASTRTKGSQAAGPAYTQESITRRAVPGDFHAIVSDENGPTITPSVMVASVGDQARRIQNVLWEQRNELDLPGIYLAVEDSASEQLAKDVFAQQITNHVKKNKNKEAAKAEEERLHSFTDAFLALLRSGSPSNWTLPHRQADAWLRTATDPDTGQPVWAGGKLYNDIINAGSTNVSPLLRLSPNSILFGYWLSIGAPVAHKMARSLTAEIIGYNANRMWQSATKSSPYPVSNRSQMSVDVSTGGIDLDPILEFGKVDSKKSPSRAGFGTIPAPWSNNTMTCADILGSTTVSFTGLRAAIAQDRSLNTEQRTAAVAALVALGVYGRTLSSQDGFLRSGCDLLDISSVWGIRRRGSADAELIEISNDPATLLLTVTETLDNARSLGVFGCTFDRIKLSPSPQGIALAAQGIIGQSIAKAEGDADA